MSQRPKVKPLSAKQQRFIREYLKDLNGTQAAIRAGYSPHTAAQQAARLLRHPPLWDVLARKTEAGLRAADLAFEDVLAALRRLVKADPRALLDPVTGDPIPIHKLSADDAYQIAGYVVGLQNGDPGDGKTARVLKVKFRNPDKAIELAMKYFGMFGPKEDEGRVDELVALLKSARRRADSVTAPTVDVTPEPKRLKKGKADDEP